MQYPTYKGFDAREAARIYSVPGRNMRAEGPLGTADGICVQPVQHASAKPAPSGQKRAWALRRLSGALLPGERVERCGQTPIKGGAVQITRNASGRHGVSNVRVCGSVWVCPVCAAKIASRRAVEVQAAIDAHHASGGDVHLLSLTVRHERADALGPMVRGLAAAQSRLWSGRWAAEFRLGYRVEGLIRNSETTWGPKTGWHPHAHVLLFTDRLDESTRLHMLETLARRWQHVTARSGLFASFEHGLQGRRVLTLAEETGKLRGQLAAGAAAASDVQTVAQYMSKVDNLETLVRDKWGAAQELTWAHIKQARGERFTPWALLAAAGADNDVHEAAALWQEYADAYKGRAQLYWSRGLRDRLGLQDSETDAEAAAAEDETAVVVGEVHGGEWGRLVRSGAALQLLDYLDSEAGDAADVPALIALWLRRRSAVQVSWRRAGLVS